MRILLCTHDFPPQVGGIQTYSYEVARGLSSRGEDVTVLAPRVEGDLEFDREQSFPVIRMKSKIELYLKFFWILRRKRIEKILVAHRSDYAVLASWANRVWSLPYYPVIYGGEILIAGRKKQICSSLERARRIVAISHFTKEKLAELGVEKEKVTIILPGVDSSRFRPNLDGSAILKKHNLLDRKVILTVAHLVRRKGHSKVIRSLPNVLKKVPNAVYLIVGSGPEEVHLRKLVHDLGLEGQVIFVTYVSDAELPIYYNCCNVFIMPSYEIKEEGDFEGFGIVFLEANACGRPVIGGRSGGVEDAIVEGETGILVNPLREEEITETLLRLLTDEELNRNLGKGGRKRVEQELNWQVISGKILGELEQ